MLKDLFGALQVISASGIAFRSPYVESLMIQICLVEGPLVGDFSSPFSLAGLAYNTDFVRM